MMTVQPVAVPSAGAIDGINGASARRKNVDHHWRRGTSPLHRCAMRVADSAAPSAPSDLQIVVPTSPDVAAALRQPGAAGSGKQRRRQSKYEDVVPARSAAARRSSRDQACAIAADLCGV
jgi:hypothetical protein